MIELNQLLFVYIQQYKDESRKKGNSEAAPEILENGFHGSIKL